MLSEAPTRIVQEADALAGDTMEAGALQRDTLEADDSLRGDTMPGGASPEAGDPIGDGGFLAGLAAVLIQLLFYTGIVGLIGVLVVRALVLPPMRRAGEFSEVMRLALGRTWHLSTGSVSAALFAVPIRLWHHKHTYYPDHNWGDASVAIAQSAWGGGWWLHVGSAMLAAVGLALTRPFGRRTVGWVVAAVGILLLPLAAAVSGDAWAAEPRWLAVGSLYLHIVAASTWLGGLFCLIHAGLPALLAREVSTSDGYAFPGAFHGFAALLGAFSRIAMVAVALLVVTGTANAWVHLDAFSQLWTTPWGRSLLIKTSFAALTIGVSFYNWRVVQPALDGSRRLALLKGPVTMELALGGSVLVATSMLVARPLG